MNWLILTLIVLGVSYALAITVHHRHKKAGWILIAVAAVLTVTLVGGTLVCYTAPKTGELAPDYGLALGYSLQNGQAAPELVERCRAALEWMELHPKTMLIVSGGDPGHQGVTEAAVMAAWLRNHGADADRILLEENASDTRENIAFGKALAEENGLPTQRVTIITSEYHQTRAAYLAHRAGQTVFCHSSRTPMLPRISGAVREIYALAAEFLGL